MSEAASILRLLASSGFGGGSGMKASHSIIFCLGKARSNQVVTSCYICTWMCLGLALNFGLPFLRLTKHVPAIAFHCFANSFISLLLLEETKLSWRYFCAHPLKVRNKER
jgi:hypothetical protein